MLPSDPASVTCVAFVALTVKRDELPGATEAGLAVIVTVGAAGALEELPGTPPKHPVNSMGNERQDNRAIG